ncbi:MerR family transcriptional regulator [Clostridia bacterium OttesenSCG-928-O13]|nr:MerR family transcriptional regulator [Clostridia bacterium OttesenSCG-928-O13]
MDIQKLTVGQMARLNRVTPETLRHYDREGLLQPWHIDEETGYRYYHINQSARLDMILNLQAHGVPLKQIRNHLNTTDPEALSELLRGQMRSIDENIRRLQQSRNAIARMVANHDQCKSLPPSGTPFYEYMPHRRIFKRKTGKNYFEQDNAGYELMLRELKQSLVAHNLPASYFFNVGTLVRREYLERRELYSDEVFFFVEEDYEGPGDVESLPEGLYLCLCAKDFSQEPAYARRLLDAMEAAGHSPAGDYVCEVVEEFPGFDAAPRSLLFKIQVPVQNSPHKT